MIAVRKPGRPLSSCPHLPGTRCGCSNVLAALPRQTNCGCPKPSDGSKPTKESSSSTDGGSSTDTSSVGNVSTAGTSSSNGDTSNKATSCCANNTNGQAVDDAADMQKLQESPPVSPTTRPSTRVEKKTTRKSAAQKQALNSAKLERMDTNSLNVMLPMSSKNQSESISVASHAATPLPGDGYQQAGNGPFTPNGDYRAPPVQAWRSMTDLPANAEDVAGSMTPQTPNGAQASSSCCSSRPSQAQVPSASSMVTSFQGIPAQPQLQQQVHVQSPPQQVWHPTNFAPNFPMNGSILVPNQPMSYGMQHHTPYYNQVAAQTYAPLWGSITHPLHPAQYQQYMDNSSQTGLQGSYPISQNPMDLHTNGTVPFTDHQCSCGKDCQCLGCPSHPYNEPTQEFIWDAMKLQFEEESKKGRTGSIVDVNNVMSANDQLTPLDETSPAVSNTPSDSASPRDQGDHNYPAENFIFVSYPPPPGAGAAMQDTCPCGPSCECIDCVIHRTLDN